MIGAVTAFVVLVVAAGSSAAPPQGAGKPDRGAVVAYWTPEHVARAVPRDMLLAGADGIDLDFDEHVTRMVRYLSVVARKVGL